MTEHLDNKDVCVLWSDCLTQKTEPTSVVYFLIEGKLYHFFQESPWSGFSALLLKETKKEK